MKKILFLFTVLVLTASVAMAQEATQDTSVITFDKSEFDVGTITPGSHVFEFGFKNTGKGVLIVTNVAPTCGCTIASWTKEPIKPGERGVVKATFNGYTMGSFAKSINVNSNSKTPVTSIKFKGVITDPAKDAKTEQTAATPVINDKK